MPSGVRVPVSRAARDDRPLLVGHPGSPAGTAERKVEEGRSRWLHRPRLLVERGQAGGGHPPSFDRAGQHPRRHMALRTVRHDEQQVDSEDTALRHDLRREVGGQFVEHADGPDDGDRLVGVSADDTRMFEVDHGVPRIGDVGVGKGERANRSPVGEEHSERSRSRGSSR